MTSTIASVEGEVAPTTAAADVSDAVGVELEEHANHDPRDADRGPDETAEPASAPAAVQPPAYEQDDARAEEQTEQEDDQAGEQGEQDDQAGEQGESEDDQVDEQGGGEDDQADDERGSEDENEGDQGGED